GHRYWRRRRRGSPPPPVGPRPREPVAEDACDHVGGAAGYERNDEADVTRGPGWSGRSLRGGRTGKPAGRQHGRGKKSGETAAGGDRGPGPPPPPPGRRREGAPTPTAPLL